MCVAVPMKIKKILSNNSAIAEKNGNEITVNIALADVKTGDFVLVHAGCVLQVLDSSAAAEIEELYAEIFEGFAEGQAELNSSDGGGL
ncbi:MAG: HypC/HybG/HupF family hydrogenase formation chaperone [Oscillospiraceae bacterium]|jgi:hydrogenase expression/formation protein HypC|nr:HypC/HybG/HupF family hydrogenase formation chaperone [Oscillospiraceae bacterium]